MPRESVGDALNQARHWLRSSGVLVNMQPDDPVMPLEVSLGSERRKAGVALDDDEATGDIRSSLRKLGEQAAAGLFCFQRQVSYEIEFHVLSPEAWTRFVERPKFGGVEADQTLLDEALARDDGRIIVIERGIAAAYGKGAGCPSPQSRTGHRW